MILSEIGEIAKREWLKSPEIRPDMNLTLDEYIIMPNHIHGIIQIGRNSFNKLGSSNDLFAEGILLVDRFLLKLTGTCTNFTSQISYLKIQIKLLISNF